MSNLVIDFWDMSQPYLQHRHCKALFNMIEEFRIEHNLPPQNTNWEIGICGIPVKDLLNRVSVWAYDKYKMKVLITWRHDKAVQSITIGFDDMTESEVFEVFIALFEEVSS